LTTGWTVRETNPGGDEIFSGRPDRPCGPPSLLYNGYRVFPEGRGGWSVGLNHPTTVEVPKVLEKSRDISLLSIRAFVAYRKGENRPTDKSSGGSTKSSSSPERLCSQSEFPTNTNLLVNYDT